MKQIDAKPHPGGGSWGAPTRTIAEKIKESVEALTDEGEDILLATGFEGAFIGIGRRHSKPSFAVYSRKLCIDILMKEGMDESEAEEYFQFNVEGAWVGEGTPAFVE